LAVVALVVAIPVIAHAQRVRPVGEAGFYVGGMSNFARSTSSGSGAREIVGVMGLRGLVAMRVEPDSSQAYQLGLVFDGLRENKIVGAIGLQLHADFELNPCWRLGALAALSLTTLDARLGAPTDFDANRYGYLEIFGVQARQPSLALELDLMRIEDHGVNYTRSGTGLLGSVSLLDRAGWYGVAGLAGGTAIVFIIGAIAISQSDWGGQ